MKKLWLRVKPLLPVLLIIAIVFLVKFAKTAGVTAVMDWFSENWLTLAVSYCVVAAVTQLVMGKKSSDSSSGDNE